MTHITDQMEQTATRPPYIDEYMQTRRYNRAWYADLVAELTKIWQRSIREFPDLEISIGMDAKYQLPYVRLMCEPDAPIGQIERDIIEALEAQGFEYTDAETKGRGYYINFRD